LVVLIPGLVVLVGGQCISFFVWNAALSCGLQEDDPNSSDMVEATFLAAISWGAAGADTLVQGTLVILTLIGIFRQKEFGYFTGNALFIIWIYDTIMLTLERIAVYKWDIEPDLSRALYIGPLMTLIWGIPGVISIACLAVNWSYFR